jgi:L-threonylcarbamoyladenylate synthase
MKSPLELAVEQLNAGNVVAMPTETVYGLAARIDSSAGIQKIFSIKQRPFFDPLIVHVSSKVMACQLTTDWSPLADFLAEHFWPGPLTMILPKTPTLDTMITSGLETVGIRMPRHSLALSLIEKAGTPLAAPSANPFGYISPTKAIHVEKQLGDKIPYIIDGGSCDIGLESTIIDCTEQPFKILRLGGLSIETIEKGINEKVDLLTIRNKVADRQDKEKRIKTALGSPDVTGYNPIIRSS